jgi:hypothetical protein
MFVVFGAVRLFKMHGSDFEYGYLWYVPVVALCWLLGAAVARWYSVPGDRALRERLLRRETHPKRHEQMAGAASPIANGAGTIL